MQWCDGVCWLLLVKDNTRFTGTTLNFTQSFIPQGIPWCEQVKTTDKVEEQEEAISNSPCVRV